MMDTSEIIQRVKKELLSDLRKEMKEMLLEEVTKMDGRRKAPEEANGLDTSLEALAKVLESSVARVRNDLRILTRKLDALESSPAPSAPSAAPSSTSAAPGGGASSKTVLPPLFHRSIPPPLLLENCPLSPKTIANSAKQVTLPPRRETRRESVAGYRHKSGEDISLDLSASTDSSFLERRVYSARERKYNAADMSESGGFDLSDDDSYYEEDNTSARGLSDSPMHTSMSGILDNDDEVISVNVGGRMFQTYRQTILRYPESLLAQFISSDYYNRETSANRHREIFFDRNSTAFEAILDFYRTGLLLKPPELHDDIWKYEIAHWNVKESEEPKDKKKRTRPTSKKKKKKKSGSHIKDIRRIDAVLEPLSTLPIRSWEDIDADKTRLLSPGRVFSNSDKLNAVSRGKNSSLKDMLKTRDKKDGKEERLSSLLSVTDLPVSSKKKDKSKTAPVTELELTGGSMIVGNEWKKKRRSQSILPSDMKKEKEKAEKSEKKEKIKRSDSNSALV